MNQYSSSICRNLPSPRYPCRYPEILPISYLERAQAAYEKIPMRHLGAKGKTEVEPLTGEDIRSMRERAPMSQAVFARLLNLTVGYVSQLERGAKRPTGAVLVLLDVICRKGIEAIL